MPQSRAADRDHALVERARRGDKEAFGLLVEQHQRSVVNLARRLSADPADAEDVAQEAFLRAFRALRQFRGLSSFRTWLTQIVVNTARTHLGRRLSRPEDPGAFEAACETVAGADLERAIVARDRVGQALATLPPDLREAVVLRDIEGLEYREMARVLDVPIGTIESRIFRGRARLRTALAGPAEKGHVVS